MILVNYIENYIENNIDDNDCEKLKSLAVCGRPSFSSISSSDFETTPSPIKWQIDQSFTRNLVWNLSTKFDPESGLKFERKIWPEIRFEIWAKFFTWNPVLNLSKIFYPESGLKFEESAKEEIYLSLCQI